VTETQGWILIAVLAYLAFVGLTLVLVELSAMKRLLREIRDGVGQVELAAQEMRDSLRCIESDVQRIGR
jgi:hypothetical protein